MSDRLFFLSALLIAGAMVWLALLPGMNALPTGPVSGGNTDYRRVEVRGNQLNRMVPGGASDISLVKLNGQTVLRIEVEAGKLTSDPLRGPHFVLASDLEYQFADRELKVTVRARAADRHGAQGIRLNYAAGNTQASGWQDFLMTREFEDVSFTYVLPPLNLGAERGYDYLAIRPEVPEKQRAIFVESIVFEPIGPKRTAGGS